MSTQAYLDGRKTYGRPQAMMWSKQPPQVINGKYVPYGLEMNDQIPSGSSLDIQDQFLILTDDNRDPLAFKTSRIETRKRMVNGQMRSYHIADKLNLSTAWHMVPSRGFATAPNFNPQTGLPNSSVQQSEMYTTDGGAGGVDMLNWYENNTGSFWVYLAYDKNNEFPESGKYGHLAEYSQAIEMFISSFDYDVIKRGTTTYDFWNVTLSLEEV